MLDLYRHTGRLVLGLPHNGHKRVLRGGSWNNNGRNLRSAQRNANTPDNRNHNRGLRLARALPTTEEFGGSVNQRYNRFRRPSVDGQSPGPQRVSQPGAVAPAQSMLPGRLICGGDGAA